MDFNVKTNKIINFFSTLEKNQFVTQSNIAKSILISIGMANSLMKKAIKKGYIKVQAVPYRRYSYYLTKKGFNEKSRLVKSFLSDSLEFFSKAKKDYIKILLPLKKKKIVVVGSGELMDITKLASIEAEVSITRFLNSNDIHLFEQIKSKDVVVMAESKIPQNIYNKLIKFVDDKRLFFPKFLFITRKK